MKSIISNIQSIVFDVNITLDTIPCVFDDSAVNCYLIDWMGNKKGIKRFPYIKSVTVIFWRNV